jgi:3-oxoacyl-[acyl-carrier-protein] synthase-3
MESLKRSGTALLTEAAAGGARVPFLRPAGILGIGSYAPERVLTNRDLETIVETNDEWIFSRTGISERRIAAPEETTADLAYHAAVQALADAGLTGADLDLIVVATVTGDAPFPATASVLQERLGAKSAAAFNLSAACAGFIYALATGAQFIQTGTFRNVLVVGAETLSRITNWRDRTTCVLFGDGAGAAVLGPVDEGQGFLSFDLGSDGSGAEQLAVDPGGWGHPLTTGSDDALTHSIRMNGGEVFKFAVRMLDDSTRRSLAQAGLTIADVDLLIPHQANVRIIDAAAKRLGLTERSVFSNVQRYGNTSAASIPLALVEARDAGRIQKGDTLVLVGFGAGLSWASCVINWSGTRKAE